MVDYLHGFSPAEQQRLIDQAEFWKDRVTLVDFPLRPNERLVELGCGVGANLRLFGRAAPGMHLAGLDREPRQIESARRVLAELPHECVDLRVGDACSAPWPDDTFDRAFLMWLIEHVTDARPVLRDRKSVV